MLSDTSNVCLIMSLLKLRNKSVIIRNTCIDVICTMYEVSAANKADLLCTFFSATHPRHYAQDGLRLLEEGDGVEGSSGFPGSVRLHPVHGPPSPPPSPWVHNLLSSPTSSFLLLEGTGCVWSAENLTDCAPELLQEINGWMDALLLPPSVLLPLLFFSFNITSKSPVLVFLPAISGQSRVCARVYNCVCACVFSAQEPVANT